MKKIMLILFSFAEIEELIQYSFKLLEEDDKLFVTAVIEEEIPSDLFNIISNIGFLGEKLTSDLKLALAKEDKERAEKNLEQIKVKADKIGREVKVEKIANDSSLKLKEIIIKREINYLLINFAENHLPDHDLLDLSLDDFLSDLNLPYEIYYNGKLKQAEK